MSGTQKAMRRTALLFAAMLLALVVFSGVALAVTKSCEALVECFGTRKADTLNGSEGRDFMFGKGRGDTLNGLADSDLLYGQGGADKLFGGPGLDSMTGGPANDALSGGEDADSYYFGDGWGKDSLADGATDGNMVFFVKGPEQDQQVPVTANLTIKLISGEGPEVKNASGTNTIEWEAHAIAHVLSGTGDDHISGNASANTIASTAGGADTISTGGGDDVINVVDHSEDDVVDCGETLFNNSDNDTVSYDSGDQIAPNCETQLAF
jgi:Ca2+-binding RTX toxin-like protein